MILLHPICYTMTGFMDNYVKIELYPEGGGNPEKTISSSTNNDWIYNWLVSGVSAARYYIKVSAVAEPDIYANILVLNILEK